MCGLLLVAALCSAPDLSPVVEKPVSSASPVAIVTNSIAALPVVFRDGDPKLRWAALYLASTIRDLTGIRPDVIAGGTNLFRNALWVGVEGGKAEDADREWFRVVAANGSVRFLGRADYAVFDWCERVLGVRNFPTDGKLPGKFVPRCRKGRLVVDPADYRDSPAYATRTSTLPDVPWVRMCKSGDSHRGGVNVHAPHRWFADPEVRTNHPAIFALMPDGSRGETPLLCYGNPETLEYYKRRIDLHISGRRDSGGIVDSSRKVITVSPWDVMVECGCEHCARLFDPSLGAHGNASPVVWGFFLRRLAEWAKREHPEYTVAFLPYLNTCLAPHGFNLADLGNCEAMLCTMPGLAMLKEPDVREREEALIGEWARITGRKVLDWHYSCWPREFTSAPYLFGRTIVGHASRMRGTSIGTFICGGNGGASERISAYVWLRALWNPSIDVDAVYDAFARMMFGAAAKPIRRLMAMQEDGWARHWQQPCCSRENVFGVSYPPDDIAEMKRLLSEAAGLARGDGRVAACVRWYAADFRRFFADAEEYARRPGRREFAVRKVAVAPKIDGRMDDAAWTECAEIPLRSAFGSSGEVIRKGTVRMAWTEKGACFAIRADEPDLQRLNLRAPYGDLRKQDSVEFYFVNGESPTGSCRRIMVDLRGRVEWSSDGSGWTPGGLRAAVGFVERGWVMELMVPFGMIGRGAAWCGNIVRWHAGPPAERERTRLSTLGGEWNQDRDAFAVFRFGTFPDDAPQSMR